MMRARALTLGLGDADDLRAVGKKTAQVQGGAAAAAACTATGAGATVAVFCGVVGAEVAGRVYDFAEATGEKYAESAYDWTKNAAGDAWGSASSWTEDAAGNLIAKAAGIVPDIGFCVNPMGCGSPSAPNPSNFMDDKVWLAELPPVSEILKGVPDFPASQALRWLGKYPSVRELMATELGPPVAVIMRSMMNSWNGFLTTQVGVNDMTAKDVENRFYRVEDVIGTAALPDGEEGENAVFSAEPWHPYTFDYSNQFKAPDPYHPFDLNAERGVTPSYGMRAGSLRNALASYVLLGMIAVEAGQQQTTAERLAAEEKALHDAQDARDAQSQDTYGGGSDAPASSGGGGKLLLFAGLAAAGYVGIRLYQGKPIIPR
jgi:hypothetical protein